MLYCFQTTPPSVQVNPETFNALLEKFQEMVQALLAQSRKESQATPETPETPPSPKVEREPDQVRCYRVPGYIVRCEREALEAYQAEDLTGLLRKARDDFYLTSFLLQNFHEDNEINGFMAQQIGERLSYPLRMLNELCSILVDFRPRTPEGEEEA